MVQDSVLLLPWPDFNLWLENWDPASNHCRLRPPEITNHWTAREFPVIAFLVGVKYYLNVLICPSLMANDGENLFLYIFGHLFIFFKEILNLFYCSFFNWVMSVVISALSVTSKRVLLYPRSRRLTPMYLAKNSRVSIHGWVCDPFFIHFCIWYKVVKPCTYDWDLNSWSFN